MTGLSCWTILVHGTKTVRAFRELQVAVALGSSSSVSQNELLGVAVEDNDRVIMASGFGKHTLELDSHQRDSLYILTGRRQGSTKNDTGRWTFRLPPLLRTGRPYRRTMAGMSIIGVATRSRRIQWDIIARRLKSNNRCIIALFYLL